MKDSSSRRVREAVEQAHSARSKQNLWSAKGVIINPKSNAFSLPVTNVSNGQIAELKMGESKFRQAAQVDSIELNTDLRTIISRARMVMSVLVGFVC